MVIGIWSWLGIAIASFCCPWAPSMEMIIDSTGYFWVCVHLGLCATSLTSSFSVWLRILQVYPTHLYFHDFPTELCWSACDVCVLMSLFASFYAVKWSLSTIWPSREQIASRWWWWKFEDQTFSVQLECTPGARIQVSVRVIKIQADCLSFDASIWGEILLLGYQLAAFRVCSCYWALLTYSNGFNSRFCLF